MADKAKSIKDEIFEWIKALLIAGAIILLIRWLAFNPFIVDGASMEPNLEHAEMIIVNKLIYEFRDPKRGEVIVFLAPEGKDYIKRVIALPGERVRVEGDLVYVNDVPIDEPYLKSAIEQAHALGGSYNSGYYSATAEVTVPENSIYVLGDNRPHSKDSRFPDVGFVEYDHIVGRADLIYWPLNDLSLVEHQ
jgi:signal peptidase I